MKSDPDLADASPQASDAQTVTRRPHVARKALWSVPQINFHWKENLVKERKNSREFLLRDYYFVWPAKVSERQMWPTSQKV